MRSSSFLVWTVVAVTSTTVFGCREVLKCYDSVLNKKINHQIGVELSGHYTYLYLSQIMDRHTNSYPKVAKYLKAKSAEELSHAEQFIQYQNQRGGTVEMEPVTLYKLGACANVETVPNIFKCAMELEAHVTRQLTQLHQEVSSISFDDRENRNRECPNVPDIPEDDLRLTQPMLVTCPLLANPANSEHKNPPSEDAGTADAEREDAGTADAEREDAGTADAEREDIVTAAWTTCDCHAIKSVAYVELADMIVHDFLHHQVEDTKEIANYFHTLKKLRSSNGTQGLGEYLFDKHLEL